MLRSIALFHALDADGLAALARACHALEPRDGTVLFNQGDPADCVYAIAGGEGFVRITAMNVSTKALMVEVFRAGDIFGEIGVLSGDNRTAQAAVDGRVRLLRIPAAAFLAAMAQSPQLGIAVARLLCRRLRRTFSLFEAATFESLEVRLAQQLLYLAAVAGRGGPGGVRLAGRLRQADLADLLGATQRSIITILNKWRAAGLVAYDPARGAMTLRDVPALEALRGPA